MSTAKPTLLDVHQSDSSAFSAGLLSRDKLMDQSSSKLSLGGNIVEVGLCQTKGGEEQSGFVGAPDLILS